MRVLVQQQLGLPRSGATKIKGHGHAFRDLSDLPAETITTRPVNVVVDRTQNLARTKSDKPPYYVPTMAEIRSIDPNGYKVVSLFAGTGGSSLGYRMAGFSVLFANEFVEAARDSYAANANPATVIDRRDIRTVTPDDIFRATGIKEGELDILDGSPPCSSFSSAGVREKGWNQVKKYSDLSQRTDDLFYEYIRIIDGVRPKVFVAENVAGLIKGVSKGYFLDILKRMKALGYRVEARLLDAQWLGVPQRRRRVFFIGVRSDLNRDPVFPTPLRYRYTLREVLPLDAPVEADADMRRFEVGKEWAKLAAGEQSERYFSLVRSQYDAPVQTVTAEGGLASLASVAHPVECRKFSIAELKRICSFPDDFVLTGTFAQQWERLGRAVPPLMMRAIATTLRDRVLR